MRLPAAFYNVESGAKPLLLAGARRLFREGKAVFIDARTSDEYEKGQIQGAFNVPFEQWRDLYVDLAPWLENQKIVVYASPEEIAQADDLAGALASRGHRDQLLVYVGSIDEWRAAGLPVRTGPDPVLGPETDVGGSEMDSGGNTEGTGTQTDSEGGSDSEPMTEPATAPQSR